MIYNYIVPKYCYSECQRTSLHPSIKTFVAICLSNISTRSLTLGHVLNSFLLIGSVSVHVCFIFLLKVIFYIVRCSLVTPNHVFFCTVNTLPCFKQLLLPAVYYHWCYSCTMLQYIVFHLLSIIAITSALIFSLLSLA